MEKTSAHLRVPPPPSLTCIPVSVCSNHLCKSRARARTIKYITSVFIFVCFYLFYIYIYNICIHVFYTPLRFRRYYLKCITLPRTSPPVAFVCDRRTMRRLAARRRQFTVDARFFLPTIFAISRRRRVAG